jgi:ketosteroid isomerase-like protein
MGYTTGRNRFTFPDPSGNIVTANGRYVTVWRKVDGAWKCVIDIWNSAPDPKA